MVRGTGVDSILLTRISDHLAATGFYITHIHPSQPQLIAATRSAGRKAARQLGMRVLTHQSDPQMRDDGLVVVAVVSDQW